MKKTLFLITLSAVVLSSCQKKYCWKCTLAKNNPGSYTQFSTSTVCDKTQTEISQYEKENTVTTQSGDQTNYVQQMNCQQN